MEKNKGLIIVVIFLSILVIVLSGYIYYDNFINYKESNNKIENSTIKNDDNDKFENLENNESIDNSINLENLEDNKLMDNSANIDFDFEELSNTLYSSVQKDDISTFVSIYETKIINSNDPPEIKCENIEVSNNTIDIIISKLKTASSIDKNITFSWIGCPPKSIAYYISVNSNNPNQVHNQSIFSLSYADGDNILLIRYNQIGYAFYFDTNEEINDFIESLK